MNEDLTRDFIVRLKKNGGELQKQSQLIYAGPVVAAISQNKKD